MEFAIVVPVLFLLVIGMLEFAFVMRDYLAVSSSTRVGARIAATGANAGQGTCPGLPIICVPGNVPALAQDAADAIQQAGTAMPQDSIDYILVYKSNDKGYPGSAGNTTMPTMTGLHDLGRGLRRLPVGQDHRPLRLCRRGLELDPHLRLRPDGRQHQRP